MHRLLNRQNGPTPEFVRWSIDASCPLRDPIGDEAPNRVERYLWALTSVAASIRRGEQVGEFCVRPDTEDPEVLRVCRIDEVTAFYGGREQCERSCLPCPANIPWFTEVPGVAATVSWAGCWGWLVRDDRLAARLDDCFPPDEVVPSDHRPAWYRMGASGKLQGRALEVLSGVFRRLTSEAELPPDWRRFQEAINRTAENQSALSVQFVPAGRVERDHWWIGPYCPECLAPQSDTANRCGVCDRSGLPHPALRKKVLGNRPFVELNSLLGPTEATRVRNRWIESQAQRKAASRPESPDPR